MVDRHHLLELPSCEETVREPSVDSPPLRLKRKADNSPQGMSALGPFVCLLRSKTKAAMKAATLLMSYLLYYYTTKSAQSGLKMVRNCCQISASKATRKSSAGIGPYQVLTTSPLPSSPAKYLSIINPVLPWSLSDQDKGRSGQCFAL